MRGWRTPTASYTDGDLGAEPTECTAAHLDSNADGAPARAEHLGVDGACGRRAHGSEALLSSHRTAAGLSAPTCSSLHSGQTTALLLTAASVLHTASQALPSLTWVQVARPHPSHRPSPGSRQLQVTGDPAARSRSASSKVNSCSASLESE